MFTIAAFHGLIILLSLIAIYFIVSSSRFKESSSKDGSRIVNYFFILLLWTIISYLSYLYYATLVICINIASSLFLINYYQWYKFIETICLKCIHIFQYYCNKTISPYVATTFSYLTSSFNKFIQCLGYLFKPIKTALFNLHHTVDVIRVA
eukprot:18871_1